MAWPSALVRPGVALGEHGRAGRDRDAQLAGGGVKAEDRVAHVRGFTESRSRRPRRGVAGRAVRDRVLGDRLAHLDPCGRRILDVAARRLITETLEVRDRVLGEAGRRRDALLAGVDRSLDRRVDIATRGGVGGVIGASMSSVVAAASAASSSSSSPHPAAMRPHASSAIRTGQSRLTIRRPYRR